MFKKLSVFFCLFSVFGILKASDAGLPEDTLADLASPERRLLSYTEGAPLKYHELKAKGFSKYFYYFRFPPRLKQQCIVTALNDIEIALEQDTTKNITLEKAQESFQQQQEGKSAFDPQSFMVECLYVFVSGHPSQALYVFAERKYNTLLWLPACMLSVVFRELGREFAAREKPLLFQNQFAFAPDGKMLGSVEEINTQYPEFSIYCHNQCVLAANAVYPGGSSYMKTMLGNVAAKFRTS